VPSSFSAEELLQELQHLFKGGADEALDDATVQAIAGRVEGITRRMIKRPMYQR
jgi:hypothetical protein